MVVRGPLFGSAHGTLISVHRTPWVIHLTWGSRSQLHLIFKKANEFLRLAEAIIESDPEAHKDRSGAHTEASIRDDSGLFNLPGNAPAA
jgi:hypothetical protein